MVNCGQSKDDLIVDHRDLDFQQFTINIQTNQRVECKHGCEANFKNSLCYNFPGSSRCLNFIPDFDSPEHLAISIKAIQIQTIKI